MFFHTYYGCTHYINFQFSISRNHAIFQPNVGTYPRPNPSLKFLEKKIFPKLYLRCESFLGLTVFREWTNCLEVEAEYRVLYIFQLPIFFFFLPDHHHKHKFHHYHHHHHHHKHNFHHHDMLYCSQTTVVIRRFIRILFGIVFDKNGFYRLSSVVIIVCCKICFAINVPQLMAWEASY